MANKHLSRRPHQHDKSTGWWWYEETGGIEIYHGNPDGRSECLLIPWRCVRAALKRKDKT